MWVLATDWTWAPDAITALSAVVSAVVAFFLYRLTRKQIQLDNRLISIEEDRSRREDEAHQLMLEKDYKSDLDTHVSYGSRLPNNTRNLSISVHNKGHVTVRSVSLFVWAVQNDKAPSDYEHADLQVDDWVWDEFVPSQSGNVPINPKTLEEAREKKFSVYFVIKWRDVMGEQQIGPNLIDP